MTRLTVTADAETDANDILDYLEREAGPRVAGDFGRRFRIAIGRFVDLPETGPPRPALGLNVRVSIVFPYVLIYEYSRDDDAVTLLRILHGRRNITRRSLSRRNPP
jgi:toxin ParE1/3/4